MYSKNELIEALNGSKSKTDILRKLNLKNNGGNFNTLTYYFKKYEIDISNLIGRTNHKSVPNKRNLNDILVKDSDYLSSSHLKERLYKEGLKQRICELCGQDENWKGKKISLILDHKNGEKYDNRFENLQIVCPNCNATLPTHCRGSRYMKKEKIKKEKKQSVKIVRIKETRVEKITRLKSKRLVERPSYNELEKEIKNFGYLKTGRKYGVSDNTIRKWMNFYQKYEN